MDVTITTLGFVGLGAVAVVMIALAWPRRTTSKRFVGRSRLSHRPASRSFTNWVAGDPVLFTGADAGAADCGAGGDGGGGGCD